MSRFSGTYPSDWPAIARQVKEQANWCCARCGHPHDPSTGHTLTVHHLDNNKSNVQWYNLAPLCQKCHLKIQAKVIMHRPWYLPHSEWFRPFVAGYYAAVLGEPADRDSVLARVDELIAMGQSK